MATTTARHKVTVDRLAAMTAVTVTSVATAAATAILQTQIAAGKR